MVLLGLILVPVIITVFGFVLGKGEVTLKEGLVQAVVVITLMLGGYYIARYGSMADTEIWNGRIASKRATTGSCCHSYPCNPHPCGTDGKSTCYDTCHQHLMDDEWYAYTTNNEVAYANTCNSPGSRTPPRWVQIQVGEPTAIEHTYTNYIKGNPNTILRRNGDRERFKKLVPPYPDVYDHYRVKRFLTLGVTVPDQARLDDVLDGINADLGPARQVNITVILTSVGEQMYLEGLKENWLGGKKNDLVVVIGTPQYPEIAWAGVMSWTKNEDIKVSIRDRLLDLKTFDGDKALAIVADEVKTKFVRRPMADYEYLASTIEPPTWATILLFVLGIGVSIGLSVYFTRNDPFNDGRWGRRKFGF